MKKLLIIFISLILLLSSCNVREADCKINYRIEIIRGTFYIDNYFAESYSINNQNIISIYGIKYLENNGKCSHITTNIGEDELLNIYSEN